MSSQFMERIQFILDSENINYSDKVVARLILRHAPDFRRVINEIQRYSVGGVIDEGILAQIENIKINDLIGSMKSKNFTGVRKWVVDNMDNDHNQIFRKIYDSLYETMKPVSIPVAILILAEYQYKSAFTADQEINTTACLVQIMMECEFK